MVWNGMCGVLYDAVELLSVQQPDKDDNEALDSTKVHAFISNTNFSIQLLSSSSQRTSFLANLFAPRPQKPKVRLLPHSRLPL